MKIKNIKFPASYSIKFSPDGSTVASLGRSIYFASTKEMKRTGKCHPFSHPAHFDFSPSGNNIVVKSTNGETAIVDCHTMEVTPLGGKKDGEGCEILYSPCGKFFITGSWQGIFKVTNVSDGTEKLYAYENQMIRSLSCSQKRDKWLIVRSTRHPAKTLESFLEILTWPFDANEPKVMEFGFEQVYASAISPDGSMAALAIYDKLLVYCLSDMKMIASFKGKSSGTGSSIFWFSSNQRIAFSTEHGFLIVSIDENQSELFLLNKYPSSFVYNDDRNLLAIGTWEKGFVEHSGKL